MSNINEFLVMIIYESVVIFSQMCSNNYTSKIEQIRPKHVIRKTRIVIRFNIPKINLKREL